MLLNLDYTVANLDEYLDKSAQLMRKAINDIEAAFPQKTHHFNGWERQPTDKPYSQAE